MNVTTMPKCYVFKCFECGGLDIAQRADKVTCSPACRVKAHRRGVLKPLRKQISDQVARDFTPAHMARFRAAAELCPELVPRIEAGELALDSMEVRRAVFEAFMAALNRKLAEDTV